MEWSSVQVSSSLLLGLTSPAPGSPCSWTAWELVSLQLGSEGERVASLAVRDRRYGPELLPLLPHCLLCSRVWSCVTYRSREGKVTSGRETTAPCGS